MLIRFGTEYSYEVVDELPKVGDIKYGRNGVDEKCIDVSEAFGIWNEIRCRSFERYAPYIVKWEEQCEDGEIWVERVCVEREDYAE